MTLRRCALVLIAPLLALCVPALSTPQISQAPGTGQFDYRVGTRNVRVWTVHPSTVTPDTRIVFVHHGVLRNGETYRRPWIQLAEQYRIIALVPEFTSREWPGSNSYHFGFLRDGGQPVPEEQWAFSAPDQIFAHYKQATGNRTERYFIYGHSAGGQFVHRMVFQKPDAMYEIAAPANAGSYTMPDLEDGWTWGLQDTPGGTPETLRRVLERRVVVHLSEDDNNPNASNLPSGARARAQGPHRLARGTNFFETAKAKAEELGATFNWSLVTIPDVAHQGNRVAISAAQTFFGPPPGGRLRYQTPDTEGESVD